MKDQAKGQAKIKGVKGTVRLFLYNNNPTNNNPTVVTTKHSIEIPATLFLEGRLALHHEIKDGKVLSTRTLVISHVRTGMRVCSVYDGKEKALKVVEALMVAGSDWDFGSFGVAGNYYSANPRVQEAMNAAMVVLHGEGWRERYSTKTGRAVFS